MKKDFFRLGVGLSVIVVHALCFTIIFFGKDAYLSPSQRLDVALLFMPITAAYVVAIVRSAVDEQDQHITTLVNLNYASVAILVTLGTLAGLLWTVWSLTGNDELDRQRIVVFEIAFGAAFGLIASDLFGKIQRVPVPDLRGSTGSGGAREKK